MNLSQHSGYSIVPIFARVVLFAAFLPAGFHKVFHVITFEGPTAEILSELGIGTTSAPAPVTTTWSGGANLQLASYQQDDGQPPAAEPVEDPAAPAAPASADLEQDSGKLATPDWVNETDRIQRGEEPESTVQVVEARALHGVTAALVNAGWNPEWRPQYMAWLAALTELLGGALIFVGLFSRVWGLALGITMCFAFYLTTWPGLLDQGPIRSLFAWAAGVDGYAPFNRMFAQLGLMALALGVFFTGGGALSADRIFFSGEDPMQGLEDVDED
jgi:uncharacterized membrane protein YphA (DoxX/SURF4 family)